MARLTSKVGTKLDRATVEAMAEEAESGYDLATALPERVGPGRPSLENGLSPRISYRVGGSLYARAKRKAESEGRSVSEIARDALERYVAE
jgi:predicted DNA-binding protein